MTITGYQIVNSIRKGQVLGIAKGNILAQAEFVSQIFRVAV